MSGRRHMETLGVSRGCRVGGRMKKLFGTVGCILIPTLLLVPPASGAIATPLEVYRNRQSATDAQTDAAWRLDTSKGNGVAPTPQRRFELHLYAQSHRTFKLEK